MESVGRGLIRPDVYNKVLGKSIYPDDLEFEDMLYAGVKRSTIPYGKVKNINMEEIRAMEDVEMVIDYTMIPGAISHGVVFKDIPTLVKDIIKRVGDPIIIIVSKNKEALKDALNNVKIEYEEFKGIFNIEDALKEDAPILGEGSNLLYDLKIKKGNIDDGFEEAKYIVENWYKTPMVEHAFLQPEASVSRVDEEGVVEVYVATQYPHYDREEVARCLNIEEEKVRIRNMTIGGAFGGREDINPQCHAAMAVYTNNPYSGAMRGFGATQCPIATESQMDMLAEKIGIHPLKFRYINAFKVGDKTATGQVLKSSVGLKKCIEKLADLDGVEI